MARFVLVYRSHLETDHQLLSGCREDMLAKVNGAWKVARRTIALDATDAVLARTSPISSGAASRLPIR